MEEIPEFSEIETLLSEADELVHRIRFDTVTDMEEADRIRFETDARNLERIKSEVRGGKRTPGTSEPAGDDMHRAIRDIVAAMRNLNDKVF